MWREATSQPTSKKEDVLAKTDQGICFLFLAFYCYILYLRGICFRQHPSGFRPAFPTVNSNVDAELDP